MKFRDVERTREVTERVNAAYINTRSDEELREIDERYEKSVNEFFACLKQRALNREQKKKTDKKPAEIITLADGTKIVLP